MIFACSDSSRAPVATPTPAPTPVVAATPRPVDSKCTSLIDQHRETLVIGRERAITSTGERGIYRNSSHDHYKDGRYELLIELELFGEPWLADFRDRAYHSFGKHCVRLIDVGNDRVELEIGLQAAHQYDRARCKMSCCPPDQRTAPDGTQECCFCSDAP